MSTNQNQAHGYRLAAIDLDGTLLAPDHTISPANARAVERLQAAGIEVVLASGRHQGTMVAFARALPGGAMDCIGPRRAGGGRRRHARVAPVVS